MKKVMITMAAFLLVSNMIHSQDIENIDEIAPFSEGLAAIRKGNQWGFIDREGELVIDFRSDLLWNKDANASKTDITGIQYPMFKEGLCIIYKIVEEGVPVYGFIDTNGDVVLEPSLLNMYTFKEGLTTGVLFEKVFRGNNEFNLKIYDFKFFDVLLNTSGEIVSYLNRRYGIQMTKKRYELPQMGAKVLTSGLIAVHDNDKGWEVRKLTMNN